MCVCVCVRVLYINRSALNPECGLLDRQKIRGTSTKLPHDGNMKPKKQKQIKTTKKEGTTKIKHMPEKDTRRAILDRESLVYRQPLLEPFDTPPDRNYNISHLRPKL